MQIARSWKDVSFILQHKKVSSLMIFPTILYMSAFYIFFTIKLVNCPFIILSPNWLTIWWDSHWVIQVCSYCYTNGLKHWQNILQLPKISGKIRFFFQFFFIPTSALFTPAGGVDKNNQKFEKERNLVSSWHRWILLHQKTTDITTTSLLPTNYFIFILNIFE